MQASKPNKVPLTLYQDEEKSIQFFPPDTKLRDALKDSLMEYEAQNDDHRILDLDKSVKDCPRVYLYKKPRNLAICFIIDSEEPKMIEISIPITLKALKNLILKEKAEKYEVFISDFVIDDEKDLSSKFSIIEDEIIYFKKKMNLKEILNVQVNDNEQTEFIINGTPYLLTIQSSRDSKKYNIAVHENLENLIMKADERNNSLTLGSSSKDSTSTSVHRTNNEPSLNFEESKTVSSQIQSLNQSISLNNTQIFQDNSQVFNSTQTAPKENITIHVKGYTVEWLREYYQREKKPFYFKESGGCYFCGGKFSHTFTDCRKKLYGY